LTHPDDAAVHEWLARGLFNALNDSRREEELERRNALLKELGQLAADHPENAAVHQVGEWVRLSTGSVDLGELLVRVGNEVF